LAAVTLSAAVGTLEQIVLECEPAFALARETGAAEEVLFVLEGRGTLTLDGREYELEPESGAYLAPDERYELRGELTAVAVRIRDPEPPGTPPDGATRAVVRRLDEQQAQAATGAREFRIVADPATGLRSATHFVGYIPAGRAPDHFHTYDEVIHVLDGEGVMHVDGAEQQLGPGTAIELPARTVHCLENTGDRVMRVVAVFRPAGSPAAAYYPDGTPAHADAPILEASRGIREEDAHS
jgi:quercetin dioxygenase-like cupin family protein